MSSRRRTTSLLTALVVAAAATLLLAVPLAGAAQRTYAPSCLGKGTYKPARFVIACGDGGFYVARLTWSRWSGAGAVAKGTAYYNLCKPDCARGRFRHVAATLTLSKPTACGHQRRFTRVVVKGNGLRPQGTVFACGSGG